MAVSLGALAPGPSIPATGADDQSAHTSRPSSGDREPGDLSLSEFAAELAGGSGTGVVGVFVDDVLALRVLQQPSSNPGYVTNSMDAVTQFSLASGNGTLGLLAHNYLAGEQFFQLRPGQTVVVIAADGSRQRFRIDSIGHYQAIVPTSPFSDFLDLQDQSRRLTALDLFTQMYAVPDQLVFQTCIERDGNLTWGRLFIVASRIEYPDSSEKLLQLEHFLLQEPASGAM